jgi:hypothetical protein
MTLSPSGARIQGDDYQHLVAWYHALRMLDRESGVTGLSIEARGVDLVDDIIVHHRNDPDEHYQVKFSVDASHPIDEAFWTAPSNSGRSILQRFWQAFLNLHNAAPAPRLGLYTNRAIDTKHAILKLRDGQRGCLGPRLREAAPGSEAGKLRKAWANHLGVAEPELLVMLDCLELLTDQGPWSGLVTAASDRMDARGLKRDALAVEQGVAAMRTWVKEGTRDIHREMLDAEIERRKLRGETPWATLVVQAIDHHLWADAAQASVDWVDLFEGHEPRTRRRLKDPALWNGRMREELHEACARIEKMGYGRVLVRGHMRLTPAFLVGHCLPDTRHFRLACEQSNGERWSTESNPASMDLVSEPEELGLGEDLAVGLSIARDLAADVRDCIHQARLPIRRFVHIRLPEIGNRSMPDAAHVIGWAMKVRDIVSQAARNPRPAKVHLFAATPLAAALFLGHFWNRVPPTQLYEDLSPGYAPSFFLPA